MTMSKSVVLALLLTMCFIAGCSNDEKNTTQAKDKDTAITLIISKDAGPAFMADGRAVYKQYCLACHQLRGEGVANLNPPLRNSEYVTGDKTRLISILLKGSNEGLDVDGNTYSNSMPPQQFLSDQQIADVLSYSRNSFGNKADEITPEDVKKLRSSTK
jgi:mono/diheme cytochrome c family protein